MTENFIVEPVDVQNTQLILVRGSVTDQQVDAIVNAANTSMKGGGGIDGLIHRLAGKGLMAELRDVAPHGAKQGEVVVTQGHNLPQAFIFHTAGPYWASGKRDEPAKLANCYRNCMIEADRRELTSIAFCSISTGVYRFPIELAAPLAVKTVADYLREFTESKLLRVVFAMYGAKEYDEFAKALSQVYKIPIEQ